MTIDYVFAGIPTADLESALAWYERLLGRPPDRFPHDREAVWQLADRALIYVVLDAERAGRGLLTLIVDDLAQWREDLRSRGLEATPPERVGAGAMKTTLADPDGNLVMLAQVG